jgi:pimeloyl-ACP methyl ester carboxylesterase
MEKVNTNGIQIAYTRRGKGYPLLLVHGWGVDHTVWNDVALLMESDFELILPDLRGFGESSVIEGYYNITDMATDLSGLLDQLGVEKIAIAGHSMGNYVSLAFVRAYPERVLGLGIISSQAQADPIERKQRLYESAEVIMNTGVKSVLESLSPLMATDERVQAQIRSLIKRQHPAGLAGALKAMADREDSSSILSRFTFPVVLIHGQADEFMPIHRAQEIKEAISHATLTELPGIGHTPILENPKATVNSLKNIIDSSTFKNTEV